MSFIKVSGFISSTIICQINTLDGDAIRSLYKYGPGQLWMRGQTNIKAAKGSSIAIIERFDANGQAPSQNHIFLQDPELRLREYLFDRSARKWVLGELALRNMCIHEQHPPHYIIYIGTFNPGVQPRGTPISAEVIQGGVDVDINVMWRDAHGRVASSSWSKLSGWDLQTGGSRRLDGRA